MILDAFMLNGRAAIVTGAARGLGQGIALGLAEAGADLLLIDVLSPGETAAQVIALGRRCATLETDLSGFSPQRAQELVALCVAQLGRADILVNNAGIIRRAAALDFAQEDWQQVLDLNLNTAFYLSQALARHAIAAGQGAKIINIASMLSFQGGVFVPSYAAAKSAIAGMTRALANEWAALRINVNAIAPGYFSTEVTAGIRADPARAEKLLERIPAGRWGEPSDLQGVAVFLASPAADYLHGAIIPVDGGWLAR